MSANDFIFTHFSSAEWTKHYVAIVDFGSQTTQLIARGARQAGFPALLLPGCGPAALSPKSLREHLSKHRPDAVIFSGSPDGLSDVKQGKGKVRGDVAGLVDVVLELALPLLTICFGSQLVAASLTKETASGGQGDSQHREFGQTSLTWSPAGTDHPVLGSLPEPHVVWMSHGDPLPLGMELTDTAATRLAPYGGTEAPVLEVLATSASGVAAFQVRCGAVTPVTSLLFHPEVSHTVCGVEMITGWAAKVAKVTPTFTPASILESQLVSIREQVPAADDERVLVACSGGVDSTVALTLVSRALGKDRVVGCFVNNGLLRKHEYEQVMKEFERLDLNVSGIDATDHFLDALEGVSDPEAKRRIIGAEFITILTRFAKKKRATILCQGTIYPDVIESHGNIKSHHNVGGLPASLSLRLLEPLRALFKDDVRRLGTELGIADHLLQRHPFPGPGLSVRILGPVSRDRVAMLQDADSIFIEALRRDGHYNNVWQAGAILLNCKTVGVQGDARTYASVVALRAVLSVNGMSADVSDLPLSFLTGVATDIVNQVEGVNRVVYDISHKPPATIEWE
jgi:GMP synthase (glutamine-hydrolysing)